MISKFLLGYFAGILTCGAAVPLRADSPALDEAAQKLREIAGRFAEINQLQYRVTSVSRMGSEQVTRVFDFSYQHPDQFRVHHHRPEDRLIVFDGEKLVEFISSARRALQTDTSALPEEQRAVILRNTLSRSVVEGLRPGEVEGLIPLLQQVRTEEDEGFTTWVLEGGEPFFRLRLDPDRNIILESEVHDSEGVLFVNRSSAFSEVAPGIWLPERINSRNRSPRGMVDNRYTLERIRVNRPFPDDHFTFRLPRGARWHNP